MPRILPACIGSIVVLTHSAWLLPDISGQELLRNGDFEGGRLLPWGGSPVAGGTVAQVHESSPFTSLYPAGRSSLRVDDDDSDYEKPSLSQTFEANGAITFAFDFKVSAGEQPSPWYVAWQGEARTTGFFFAIGGADPSLISLNQEPIADIKADVWYHIEGWAHVAQQAVHGTVISAEGERAEFQGGFPFGLNTGLTSVEISDGDAGRNPAILFDNFSTRPIALEIKRAASGHPLITWPARGFRLQSASSLGADANWIDVPSGDGVYTNTLPDQIRFFRLAR